MDNITHEYAQNLLQILLQVNFLEPRGKNDEYRITPDGQAAFNALSWFTDCGCSDKCPPKH